MTSSTITADPVDTITEAQVLHYLETHAWPEMTNLFDVFARKQEEEFAKRESEASVGSFVTLWDTEPEYLDGLSGDIVAIEQDEDDVLTATVRLDPLSVGRLRFNRAARLDGYRTRSGLHFEVTVPASSCLPSTPLAATAGS